MRFQKRHPLAETNKPVGVVEPYWCQPENNPWVNLRWVSGTERVSIRPLEPIGWYEWIGKWEKAANCSSNLKAENAAQKLRKADSRVLGLSSVLSPLSVCLFVCLSATRHRRWTRRGSFTLPRVSEGELRTVSVSPGSALRKLFSMLTAIVATRSETWEACGSNASTLVPGSMVYVKIETLASMSFPCCLTDTLVATIHLFLLFKG